MDIKLKFRDVFLSALAGIAVAPLLTRYPDDKQPPGSTPDKPVYTLKTAQTPVGCFNEVYAKARSLEIPNKATVYIECRHKEPNGTLTAACTKDSYGLHCD